MATLRPTHTLTQMPKNLPLVVATPKRLGALPVVIIINRLVLKEITKKETAFVVTHFFIPVGMKKLLKLGWYWFVLEVLYISKLLCDLRSRELRLD